MPSQNPPSPRKHFWQCWCAANRVGNCDWLIWLKSDTSIVKWLGQFTQVRQFYNKIFVLSWLTQVSTQARLKSVSDSICEKKDWFLEHFLALVLQTCMFQNVQMDSNNINDVQSSQMVVWLNGHLLRGAIFQQIRGIPRVILCEKEGFLETFLHRNWFISFPWAAIFWSFKWCFPKNAQKGNGILAIRKPMMDSQHLSEAILEAWKIWA